MYLMHMHEPFIIAIVSIVESHICMVPPFSLYALALIEWVGFYLNNGFVLANHAMHLCTADRADHDA